MRLFALAAPLAALLSALPALAEEPQMVTLKAEQVGQIFCLSRIGNDEAVISGLLTDGLRTAIAAAEARDDAWARSHPDEKPPLGDGIPWQSAPDYADGGCAVGLTTLSRTDARVELDYSFKDAPDAGFTDTLILKKIPLEGMNVGYWRIDNVLYPDGTDLRAALVSAFDGYQ